MRTTLKHVGILLVGCLMVALMIAAAQAKDTIKIGIAWESKSAMAERVTKGMVESLKKLAPQIQIEYQKNLKDIKALGEVIKCFEREKAGMVIMRSSGSKYLVKHQPTIPTFIGACNHPVQLGVLKNMGAPEGNITGVTYALPHEMQFKTFLMVLPEMKSVLLLLEKGHPSSPLDQKGTKAACRKLNIDYSDRVCKTIEEAVEVAKQNSGKVSCIILGAQALLIDNAAKIVAGAGSVPVVSYTEKPVEDGALCGLVVDDFKLGKMLGKSVVDVLVKGKAIRDVPVKLDLKPQIHINAKTAKKLGVKIPANVLDVAKIVGK